jgi:hypothetical protein
MLAGVPRTASAPGTSGSASTGSAALPAIAGAAA